MLNKTLKKKIAKRIVWSMNMHKGESLRVNGGSHFQDLLEEIAIQAMKEDVDVTFGVSSDDFTRRVYSEVPIKSLKRTSKISMKMIEALDNYIGIDKIEDPRIVEKFPPQKTAAIREAGEPISKKIQRLGIKTSSIGYPTEKLAKKLGVY